MKPFLFSCLNNFSINNSLTMSDFLPTVLANDLTMSDFFPTMLTKDLTVSDSFPTALAKNLRCAYRIFIYRRLFFMF